MRSKQRAKELGFGNNTWQNNQRFFNNDGSTNVKRTGKSDFNLTDIFHRLTTMSWGRFLLIIMVCYFVANLVFASVYYMNGVQNIAINPVNPVKDWLECFFFSTQCFTTVGFGRSNPMNTMANVLSSIESIIGLLSAALGTGLLYGRFSRPRAELIHSHNLVFAPYKPGVNAFMFRIASTRKYSTLLENQVSLSVGLNFKEGENGLRRRFFPLELELDKINFLTLSWTIVHPVTEDSPLYNMTYEDLIEARVEFIALFKAFEETYSQGVYDKFSFFGEEIVWGAKFDPVVAPDKDGVAVLDLSRIGDHSPAKLHQSS